MQAVGACRWKKTPEIVHAIQMLLEHDTAGDPISGLKWTRKSTVKISQLLAQAGLPISPNSVARLLDQMHYRLRVNHKALAGARDPHRNEQFGYIGQLRRRFERRSLPIISVDTKKRELIGNFKNPGTRWDRSPIQVNDHDFRTDSSGIAIPYGIYDLLANRGAIIVGISHDTPRFAARRHRPLVVARGTGPLRSRRPTADPRR